MRQNWTIRGVLGVSVILTLACGLDERGVEHDSLNVTQSGYQDVGEFRDVVEGGGVPASSSLTDVGFFSEHGIDLPDPECDEALCFHPMLAVAPRFDGGNWTMAYLAANSRLEVEDLERPAAHVVLIVDSVEQAWGTFPARSRLVETVGGHLKPEDHLSVIVAGSQPQIAIEAIAPPELESIEYEQLAAGYPSVVRALLAALDVVGANARPRELVRVIVAVQGFDQQRDARVGATVPQPQAEYDALAATYAERGIVVSTIDSQLDIAGKTFGNSYTPNSEQDLYESLELELTNGLAPLARDVRLTIRAGDGFEVGAVYGAATAAKSESEVQIRAPALLLGRRRGADEASEGRRGGGGGWFVELRPKTSPGEADASSAIAYEMELEYIDGASGEQISQSVALATPLGVGNNPPGDAPHFSDPSYAKPFMMLNMFLALRTATELAEVGECGAAGGVADMMAMSVAFWSQRYADPDIDEDYQLLLDLTANIGERCFEPIANPIYAAPHYVHASCFMF